MPTSRPGELNPKAKLTESDVREIRRSAMPQAELASKFGVGQDTIWSIRTRVTWRHLDSYETPESLSYPDEQWRQCCTGYEASTLGRIRRCSRSVYLPQRPRQTAVNRYGYEHVVISENNRPRRVKVHGLVAAAFLGPRPDGYHVNHINGIKTDNRLENLEYVTPSENAQHAVRLGLKAVGERSGTAKLTRDQVRQIQQSPKRLVTSASLAMRFGVAKCTIDRVRQGVTWHHDSPRSTRK